jgi:hypothetical protein
MPGLVLGMMFKLRIRKNDMGGRVKPGHDALKDGHFIPASLCANFCQSVRTS